jgi:polar amino acid transport system substrate-binding protein
MLALLASGVVAAGCGSDNSSSSTTSASSGDVSTLTDGTLLIATDAPYPPFEIGTPADSDFGGFDIDVANAVAEKLGLTPEFQDTSFDTIFRDVAAGQFDIVVAASTITPGRQQTVNFSDPYYEAQQALVVPTGSDITSVDDLAGKIVGAQDGTTGEVYANDETDAGEVRGFPEGPDAINALVTGQVDATIIDQPVAVDATDKTDGIEIAAEIPTNELYGMALSKENTALLDAVNKALVEMKGDGTITDLYQKYFQTDPPDSVLDGTTENPG